MSNSINWELLETQFFSDGEYRDKLAKMVTIVDEAFLAGRNFAQHFSKKTNKELFFDLGTFNLGSPNNESKKFDITNPNNLSSCQGLVPEENQNYFKTVTKSSLNASDNNISLDILKNVPHLSENLYKKITSSKKFELEPSEINELNEIAFLSVNSLSKSENNKIAQNNINNNSNAKSEDINNNAQVNITETQKNTLNTVTKNILSSLPFIAKQKDTSNVKWRNREALQFMRGVMDEFTHLGNFSIPFDTSLIIGMF